MPSTSFTSSDGNAFEWLTLSRSCERSGRDAAVRSARRASARGGSHGHVVGTLQRARATRKHHLLRQRRREGAQHHATSTATRREVRHVSLHRETRGVYHELIDAIDRRGREGARRAVSIHRTVLRPLLAEFNIAVEAGRRRTSSPSNV